MNLEPGQDGPNLSRNQEWRWEANKKRAEAWQLANEQSSDGHVQVPPIVKRKAAKRLEQRAKASERRLQASVGDACEIVPPPPAPVPLPKAEFPPPKLLPLTTKALSKAAPPPKERGCGVWAAHQAWCASVREAAASARKRARYVMDEPGSTSKSRQAPTSNKAAVLDLREEVKDNPNVLGSTPKSRQAPTTNKAAERDSREELARPAPRPKIPAWDSWPDSWEAVERPIARG